MILLPLAVRVYVATYPVNLLLRWARQAAEKRQRVEVNGRGAVRERPLQDDPDEALGAVLDVVTRRGLPGVVVGDRRTQDVLEERLATSVVLRASMVPPPRLHTVRYAGVLSSASKWLSLVIPPPPPAPNGARRKGGKRSRYWRWAELLRRTLGLDPEICDRCGRPMKLVSLVTDPDSIDRYLRHIGEPTEPPRLCPARSPPYYQSRVLRRRTSPQQAVMFDS